MGEDPAHDGITYETFYVNNYFSVPATGIPL